MFVAVGGFGLRRVPRTPGRSPWSPNPDPAFPLPGNSGPSTWGSPLRRTVTLTNEFHHAIVKCPTAQARFVFSGKVLRKKHAFGAAGGRANRRRIACGIHKIPLLTQCVPTHLRADGCPDCSAPAKRDARLPPVDRRGCAVAQAAIRLRRACRAAPIRPIRAAPGRPRAALSGPGQHCKAAWICVMLCTKVHT